MDNQGIIALSGLARRLVMDSVLDERTAAQAHQEAREARISFMHHVVASGKADGPAVVRSACQEFGVPLLDLDAFDKDNLPRDLVSEKLLRQHQALPLLKRGNRLFIAVADPTNLTAIDEIQFNTGLSVEAILVAPEQLQQALEHFLEQPEESLDAGLEDSDLEALEVDQGDADTAGSGREELSKADDAPIVRFVNKILLDAVKLGASDIHFEPYEKSYRIRFRTDGILHEVARPPFNLRNRLAARLKVMSKMDISERRLPQDGSIKMRLSKTRTIDFRANTLPTLWGEKIVLRILDPTTAKMDIDRLGMEDGQQQLYQEALKEPQGMILVTGPTGSGKTVTLYCGLNILNQPERNISTAEDPVELHLDGINQVNINTKVGLDFAQALRAFLRQDPDVLMVGEVRDLETAEISVKAAQTGHLVLSTLHTNSAAETLTRLHNMGIAPFNIATSVNLIVAQRLARRLCSHCKRPADIPATALLEEGFQAADLKQATLYRAIGCDKCNQGYKGRVGLYEVVKITPALSKLIMNEGNALELAELARKEGFADLRSAGLKKVLAGVTTLEEINRVTQE